LGTPDYVDAWFDGVLGEFLEGYGADARGCADEDCYEVGGESGGDEGVGGLNCGEGNHCC
jgi:hypothetical protein